MTCIGISSYEVQVCVNVPSQSEFPLISQQKLKPETSEVRK